MPKKTLLFGVLVLALVSSAAWAIGHRSHAPADIETHSAPVPAPSGSISSHFGTGRDDNPSQATKKSEAQTLAADFTLAYFSGATSNRQVSLRALVTPELYRQIVRQHPRSTGLKISIDESDAFVGGESDGQDVTISVRFEALPSGATFATTYQTTVPLTMTTVGLRVNRFPSAPVEVHYE